MTIYRYSTAEAVAQAAAEATIDTLQSAITAHGVASWVLAGGTAPNLAYQLIAERYLNTLDWSKVTFLIGDERIGALDSPDNNWHVIDELLLRYIPQATFLRPRSDISAEQAARDYEQQLHPIERFDVVWLGMGPDGHTLSLFPNHPDFEPEDTRLVVPVHHSPKPPADRISLTLHALQKSQQTLILATGESKREAFSASMQPNSSLPTAQAARLTRATWLTDIQESA